MSQVRTSPSDLPFPLRVVGSGLRRLPGAEQVSKVADSALDRIGAVSPRGRRIAVYTGAGVLGVAGVVEWPLAVTGAAVAWLTQPRPRQGGQEETAQDGRAQDADAGAAQNGGQRSAAGSGPVPTEAADADPEPHGPGNKLASSHFHHDRTASPVHDEPAKVGDPATASGLKRIAEATAHHHEPGLSDERP
ncbi:hypothetical protein ACFY5C_33085 [Streptomyces sp. NPDC012935]|uniref:hypothetical protein n=1 Tax=Streptomyces sp. NPDC012935 TaxID=3364857 RepID=UPI003675533D